MNQCLDRVWGDGCEIRGLDSSGRNLDNVKLLGPRPYQELPRYLAAMDVGLIPFKQDRVTYHADPIMTLVRLTCPIALLSFYPLSVYLVLLANAATYALLGLIVENLRRRLNHAG